MPKTSSSWSTGANTGSALINADRGVYNCAVAATEPSINGLCSRVCHAGVRLPSVTIRSRPPLMRSTLSVLRKPTTSGSSTQRVI